MSNLKVYVLQQPLVWMDPQANLRHFEQQVAQIEQADLIVLPEMFTTGFAMTAAECGQSEQEVCTWLAAQAARTQALVCGSVAVATPQGAVNRFLFVTPEGERYHYDKRHLFRMGGESNHFVAGDQRTIIGWRGWRILPQVCYDLRFPVFARNQNDYDLAIYVASWPAVRSAHWRALLLARAIENQAWVIGCNRVGSDAHGATYQGDSQIITPQGEILSAAAPGAAASLVGELSLSELQAYREQFPAWRDADSFQLNPLGQ